MFRSLYSKLAIVLTLLFVLVGLSFVLVTTYAAQMYQQEVNQRLNAQLAQHIVNEEILMLDRRINKPALERLFHALMVINPSIELYLLSKEGGVIAYSAAPGKVKRHQVDLEPVHLWLSSEVQQLVVGDDPRSQNSTKVFSAAKILHDGVLQGYLYIILGGETFDNVVDKIKGSHILRLSAWMIAASLLFALLAGLLLFASLTARLRRLSDAVDAFKGGRGTDLLKPPKAWRGEPSDEIGQLSVTFQEMARQIEAQMDTLTTADRQRRELIANISHDLRTPLATLQGYIETLYLRDDRLTGDDRREYLFIANRHCDRLSKLVDDLLQLAKLDSYEINARKEPFNLAELVSDILQKYQLKAKEKKLRLNMCIGKSVSLVDGDIGLIERALENLITNALRYTPEGGDVLVTIISRDNDVIVSVSDTGIGIPDAELPHIFDRFYRVDKSRYNDSGSSSTAGGSGLGLAITKRIIELHGSAVTVQSQSGRGARFSFHLPVHMA